MCHVRATGRAFLSTFAGKADSHHLPWFFRARKLASSCLMVSPAGLRNNEMLCKMRAPKKETKQLTFIAEAAQPIILAVGKGQPLAAFNWPFRLDEDPRHSTHKYRQR